MKFKTKPYEHQIEVFNLFKDRDFYAIFMEMGTGKTKVAIDIASYLYQKGKIEAVLLIAPNGVHYAWYSEQLPEHSPIPIHSFLWNSKKFDRRHYQIALRQFEAKNDQLKWFCANVEYFSTAALISIFKRYLQNHKCFLIVDESTRIKNPKANRTKTIIELSRMANYRTILTGSPVTNSPFDLWSMFEFLKHNFWDCNYFMFMHRYGLFVKDMNRYTGKTFQRVMNEKDYEAIKRRIARGESIERISAYTGVSEKNIQYILTHPEFTGYKNINDLKKIIEPHVFYKNKADCLDLPPKIYEKIYVEFGKEQKRIYKDLVKLLLARYENTELSVQNKVSLTLRLMQICGGFFPSPELRKPELIGDHNVKVIKLVEDLEEIGDERVIIWAHFIAEIEYILEILQSSFPNWRTEAYYGKTDKLKRQVLVKEFQDGKIKILICNQQTASFGLNLQRSNLHYFFSNTYSLEHRLQAEDRSHRSGQKWPVCYKDIIIKDSIEERVLKVLKNKKGLLDYFKTHTLKDLLKEEK
ncbi:MAG: DEAD/DEAH box helicase [Candidatus Heimdallarchaeaceae archaeon]